MRYLDLLASTMVETVANLITKKCFAGIVKRQSLAARMHNTVSPLVLQRDRAFRRTTLKRSGGFSRLHNKNLRGFLVRSTLLVFAIEMAKEFPKTTPKQPNGFAKLLNRDLIVLRQRSLIATEKVVVLGKIWRSLSNGAGKLRCRGMSRLNTTLQCITHVAQAWLKTTRLPFNGIAALRKKDFPKPKLLLAFAIIPATDCLKRNP